jgi:hypothetical protein
MSLLLEFGQADIAQAAWASCAAHLRSRPLVGGSRLTDAAGNAGLVHGEVHAVHQPLSGGAEALLAAAGTMRRPVLRGNATAMQSCVVLLAGGGTPFLFV